ncbi:hypothetical protein Asi02nite_36200 [Asanoa siamensis]|uniref:Uncharacterized protein n=1 Tax=Asanoa siamensis TaxID=926357 RepID=A0ABQ4CS41_9ACTN|nr:hypothetical protein Asi02nite_36200 [Asanoa siamensis]
MPRPAGKIRCTTPPIRVPAETRDAGREKACGTQNLTCPGHDELIDGSIRVLADCVPQPRRRGVAPPSRLDHSTPLRMDRRPQPAPRANAGGSATGHPAHPGRDAERTPDPCPPYLRPTPGSGTNDNRPFADPDATPQAGPSDAAGQR